MYLILHIFIIYPITMLKKIFKQEFTHLIKTSWTPIIWVSIFIGFLLFLLNIFLGISLYANQFTGEIKDRLGMYFYIKDIPDQEAETYKRVISLKDQLESKWLKVMFSSKDDALNFLEKKIPDVVNNFQKFGIDNPLPSTLYVMFDSNTTYESLKNIIIQNKDIILNIKDIDSWSTLQQQENRTLNIINLSNFIIWLSYVIITTLFLIVLSLIWFLLRHFFQTFHKELEIKKTLWATYHQIMTWFLSLSIHVLWFSFIICLLLLFISWMTINYYIYTLFGTSIWGIFNNISLVLWVLLTEIIIVAWTGFGFSYFFARILNKKL